MSFRYGYIAAAFLLASATPALAQSAPAAMACGDRVTIGSGDTLGAIAARCGTTVAAIQAANPGLGDPRRLQIGTEVMLPMPTEGAAPTATAADAPSPPAAAAGGHVIREGDTWDSIAQETGTSVQALMDANPGIASIALNSGTRLEVPPRGEKGPPPELPVAGLGTGGVPGAERQAGDSQQPVGDVGPDGLRVVGQLTGEGVECPALRSLDGTLYTLSGDIGQFSEGDQVVVSGREAEMSTCMQGTTIIVESIAPAS